MKKILLTTLIVGTAWMVQAQSCAQTLRLAISSYDQGRLHELPGLLKKCLDEPNGFSKSEKIAAYRLLTLSYIYLEEPEQADSSMIRLLDTDHFYEPNQAVDPAEFIGLYKTFRTQPIFSWGLKGGINITQPSVISNYYVGNKALGTGTYSTSIGIQGGLVFEKAILQGWKGETWKRFTLAPEIQFVSRAFGYENILFEDYVANNSTPTITTFIYTESQSWIDLNVMLQYKLKPKSKIDPYVAIGPGISYLLSSLASPTTTRGTTGNVVTGPNVDLTTSYKSLVYSVTGAAGIKYKLGSLYATLEVRYQYGLVNVVNEANRTNSEFSFDYAAALNDYSMNNIALQAGIVVPVFKPQKLVKKKNKK